VIVLDSGVLYAGADDDDARHAACSVLLDGYPGPLFVPVTVITETAWLIEHRLGPAAEARFLRATRTELTRVDLLDDDWDRAIELVETYADLGLGLVDASVVAVAERLGVTSLATLNHRDFRVVRPRHIDAFELIP
jgi:predicted nucleic acid-binding protein